MPDKPDPKDDNFEVGYGKPPKHGQFVPGQSGFKGRRKRRPETQAEIVARIRDETVTINGQIMSKFELAMISVINRTIKSGKPSDVKALLELLDKHGARPEVDRRAEVEAGAESATQKILKFFDQTHDIDPEDVTAIDRTAAEEVKLVMGCPHCGPVLRERWRDPDYKARQKRYGGTRLHAQVCDFTKQSKRRC